MKKSTLLFFFFAFWVSTQLYAQDPNTVETVNSAETVSIWNYIIAVVVGMIGNFAHLVKKDLKGQSDKQIKEYLRDYTLTFIVGLLIAAVVVIGEIVLIFNDVKGVIFTAFLTGYTADSIFGKYVSPQSTTTE